MPAPIQKYPFKPGLPWQIEIVDLEGLISRNQGFLKVPHRTDFFHIFVFGDCSPVHTADFIPVQVTPGSLLFLNQNHVHQFDLKAPYSGKVLIFTDQFFGRSPEDIRFLGTSRVFHPLDGNPVLEPGSKTRTRLLRILDWIREETSEPGEELKEEMLHTLLKEFLFLADREKRQQEPAARFGRTDLDLTLAYRAIAEDFFTEKKPVAFYAEKLLCSEKRLGQATGKILGKSPKSVLDDRVILEARRLLAHQTGPVKEIAFSLGFDEPTNFIKFFRKHTGMTPVDFRQTLPR